MNNRDEALRQGQRVQDALGQMITTTEETITRMRQKCGEGLGSEDASTLAIILGNQTTTMLALSQLNIMVMMLLQGPQEEDCAAKPFDFNEAVQEQMRNMGSETATVGPLGSNQQTHPFSSMLACVDQLSDEAATLLMEAGPHLSEIPVDVNRRLLPPNTQEGDVLKVTFTQDPEEKARRLGR